MKIKTVRPSNPWHSFLGGLLFLVAGCWMAQDVLYFKVSGVRNSGTVIEVERERNYSSEGSKYRYSSIVEFQYGKETVRFKDKTGSSRRGHEAGDHVIVLHDANTPSNAIIDRGVWDWLFPVIFSSLGVWGIIASALQFKSRQKT